MRAYVHLRFKVSLLSLPRADQQLEPQCKSESLVASLKVTTTRVSLALFLSSSSYVLILGAPSMILDDRGATKL
jgi:hypothetical protein